MTNRQQSLPSGLTPGCNCTFGALSHIRVQVTHQGLIFIFQNWRGFLVIFLFTASVPPICLPVLVFPCLLPPLLHLFPANNIDWSNNILLSQKSHAEYDDFILPSLSFSLVFISLWDNSSLLSYYFSVPSHSKTKNPNLTASPKRPLKVECLSPNIVTTKSQYCSHHVHHDWWNGHPVSVLCGWLFTEGLILLLRVTIRK